MKAPSHLLHCCLLAGQQGKRTKPDLLGLLEPAHLPPNSSSRKHNAWCAELCWTLMSTHLLLQSLWVERSHSGWLHPKEKARSILWIRAEWGFQSTIPARGTQKKGIVRVQGDSRKWSAGSSQRALGGRGKKDGNVTHSARTMSCQPFLVKCSPRPVGTPGSCSEHHFW